MLQNWICRFIFFAFFCYVDLFAIPDFAVGGMENWGLITYSEDSLLYSSVDDGERSKQRVSVVVAHELAHQVSSAPQTNFVTSPHESS